MHLVGGMSAASLGTHRAMVNPAGALAAPGGLGHHASWAAAVVADGIGAPRGGGPDVKPPRGLGLGVPWRCTRTRRLAREGSFPRASR